MLEFTKTVCREIVAIIYCNSSICDNFPLAWCYSTRIHKHGMGREDVENILYNSFNKRPVSSSGALLCWYSQTRYGESL